jgi:hypothetical protein
MFPTLTGSPTAPRARGLALLRARVALQRARLDAALCEGADPAGSRELSLRAGQLTRRRRRLSLAAALERAMAAAERPRGGAAIPVHRPAVRQARGELLGLARDLVERAQPAPRGVALTSRLLSDGDGPLYRPGRNGDLSLAAIRARRAL